ncbi:hypothetical protein [Aestuariibaculum marinum]|uniref:Outer membrane protein beta-barrel domain-containing protein n=1 Tax=Aestuariibaculum marinum TaxID=2683592 RepID=A0A8J6U825_9FLAO|nr:hypothetical protein [Aestuariibaculum marinum]MBD0823406.1 hypothetical protein [Aestuariibaculum marinum]
MSDKKHIDRLFQERFKDFEATPNGAVWNNIEAQLGNKKKKRVIPIWWRYGGVAAALLLLLTLGNLFFNNNNTTPVDVPTIVNTNSTLESSNNDENAIASENNETINPEEQLNENPSEITTPVQQNSKPSVTFTKNSVPKNKNSKASINSAKNTIAKNHTENNNNTIIANSSVSDKIEISKSEIPGNTENPNEPKTETTIASTSIQKEQKDNLSIEEAIKNNNAIADNKSKPNRWTITPNVAPVYFNSLGEGSSLDQQFVKNSKTGEVNMSYGINASYAINKKVRIRSGINRVNLGYNTNDVVVYESTAFSSSSRMLKNVSSSGSKESSLAVISSNNIADANKAPETFKSFNTSLNQSFGFIEVPLEIEYAITNKKLGINVIGGFSSLFLNNNEVYSQPVNGSRTYIGEAININNVSYSANFGLGLNYKVTKKLDLNLEPMFKYQINTFENTSGDFKPYFIGVYSGFSIKF